jgi:chemotaxis protein CheD
MVRMGEWAIAHGDGKALVSIGLGSCIGLALLDTRQGLAGLAHVMLPNATGEPAGSEAKFADRAVPFMLERLLDAGAMRTRLQAVLVGGARMFSFGAGTLDVGARNERITRETLESARIPVRAAATLGTTGRTIRVYPGDGVVVVREAGGADVQLFPVASAGLERASRGLRVSPRPAWELA